MAIKTNSDIQIENISYTNKDFSQIYPELVDLAKKITNKWDPETTNESDPGLVLLKLLAFIADKNNYNIDKNILEQFMPSVTQETSMRNLCEMLGYNPVYYRSAIADVSFTYLGGNEAVDNALNEGTTGVFLIKAFDTFFKTEDNIVYTLLEDMSITSNERVSTKRAIQGQLKALNLSSSSETSTEATKIQLYNLDENNRIYIPEIMVAENGIFINKEIYNEQLNNNAWRRVDNLNDQELGSKVFKFGFDSSKNLPYIEFPSDIAELIEDGLEIYYVVTDGVNGYAKAGTLTAFNSLSSSVTGVTSLEESQYTLTNNNAITGSEPETIDEAYNSFKRTVGTFNTLVSCKDYSNYIYRYQDDSNNYLVSNVQATDIRTDPNKSINLLTRDINGMTYYVSSVKTTTKDEVEVPVGNYYDLILHGTKPYSYDITNLASYNNTYQLLDDQDIVDIGVALDDVKTLSHVLTKPLNTEINFIEQRYVLKVNISTKYKVNSSEQAAILKNVQNALYENFNSRELEFGEEIPYDEIVKVVENADERIKLVVVDDPTITPYIVKGDGSSHAYDPVNDTSNDSKNIVIENILGGRIQLYIKDNSFSFDYTMNLSNLNSIKNVAAIKTSLTLSIPTGEPKYKLKKNESIQIIEDSYISDVTYPAYVYFGVSSDDNHEWSTTDGVPYELKEGEILYIYYTDSNDTIQIKKYEQGTIIRSNGLGLPNTQRDSKTAPRYLSADGSNVYDNASEAGTGAIPMYALGTNETIEILKLNETILSNGQQRCFWYSRPSIVNNKIVNQKENDLIFYKDDKLANTYYHILEEDELFIYPSSDGYSLFTLGSGTKLQVTLSNGIRSPFNDGTDKYGEGTLYLARTNSNNNIINLEDLENALSNQDVNNFLASYKWNILNFASDNLHIVETAITTFAEGTEMTSLNELSLNSTWKSISKGGIQGDSTQKNIGEVTNAKIRAILSFNGNSVNPQLVEDDDQTITIYYYDSSDLDKDGYIDENINGNDGKYDNIWLTGETTPDAELGSEGDLYLDKTTGKTYKKQSTSWTLISSDESIQDKTNNTWLIGDKKPTEEQGTSDNLYLDTKNGNVYQKRSVDWVLITNINTSGSGIEPLQVREIEAGRRIQLNTSIDNYNDIILRQIHYREEDLSLVFEDQYDVPCETIDYKLYSDSAIGDNPTDAEKLYKLLTEKHINKSAQRDEYFITKKELSSIFDPSGTGSWTTSTLSLKLKDGLELYVNVFNNQTGTTTLVKNVEEDGKNTLTLDFSALSGKDVLKDKGVAISVPTILVINPLLKEGLNNNEDILNNILDTIKKYNTFDYLAELSNSKLISSYDVVNSFFDYNNVYNPLTIGRINFRDSEFNIVASSRK